MGNLSQFQVMQGRRIYNVFNFINSVSYALVTGNIVILYALYLGASSVVIGLISSFAFLSYFAIPVGKMMARKKPLLHVFAQGYLIRSLVLIPMLFIPLLVKLGVAEYGLMVIILCNLAYNFFRGVGLVANNPVLSDLTPGRDRGSYIVIISLICNVAAIVATLSLAFLLEKINSLTAFNIAIAVGIVTGAVAALSLYKMPLTKTSDQSEASGSFSKHFIEAFKDRNFVSFVIAFLIIGVGVGMSRPFIIVYCRDVYGQSDSMITIVSFFTNLGAIVMGAVTRLFIDRIGSRPMYILYSIVSLLSLFPVIIAPSFNTAFFTAVFLCVIAMLTNLGFAGEENAAQAFFFTIIPRRALTDLSIFYFFMSGVTGSLGSILGGVILDALLQGGLSKVDSYRVFFIMQGAVIALALYFQSRLKGGGYSLRNALPMFFSPKDLRAMNLLYKLDRTEDADTQTVILSELRTSNSAVATDNLLMHLSSPRFNVRLQALSSMESLPYLTEPAKKALRNELHVGEYTTAYMAARLLGKFKVSDAIEDLRETIFSEDYHLSGESMVALAKLGDERAQMLISSIAVSSKNPYIILWAVEAMEIYANATSIPVLQDILRIDFESKVVHNEIMLALSTIVGIQKRFYNAYARYIQSPSLAREILTDLYEEKIASVSKRRTEMPSVYFEFLGDRSQSECFAALFTHTKEKKGVISAMLIHSILDTDLVRLESFRFFLCFWAILVSADKRLLLR